MPLQPHAQPLSFDLEEVRARTGGDDDLLVELATMCRAQLPGGLADIRQAIAAADAKGLERVAHKLRGSLGAFSARHAADVVSTLEQMGRTGNLEGAEAQEHALTNALTVLAADLASLRVTQS